MRARCERAGLEVELIAAADRAAGSLVAGAIARALDDAYESYRARVARARTDQQEASTVQD